LYFNLIYFLGEESSEIDDNVDEVSDTEDKATKIHGNQSISQELTTDNTKSLKDGENEQQLSENKDSLSGESKDQTETVEEGLTINSKIPYDEEKQDVEENTIVEDTAVNKEEDEEVLTKEQSHHESSQDKYESDIDTEQDNGKQIVILLFYQNMQSTYLK
jgi:hypothetical protein